MACTGKQGPEDVSALSNLQPLPAPQYVRFPSTRRWCFARGACSRFSALRKWVLGERGNSSPCSGNPSLKSNRERRQGHRGHRALGGDGAAENDLPFPLPGVRLTSDRRLTWYSQSSAPTTEIRISSGMLARVFGTDHEATSVGVPTFVVPRAANETGPGAGA